MWFYFKITQNVDKKNYKKNILKTFHHFRTYKLAKLFFEAKYSVLKKKKILAFFLESRFKKPHALVALVEP